jgi:hypothetical protein
LTKDFIQSEDKLREMIDNSQDFEYEGKKYLVSKCCKPMLQGIGGEVKTDVFILAECILNKEVKEFKISYKKPNWAFMENKLKKEKAEQIYGPKWSSIIRSQIIEIREKGYFEDAKLFYAFKRKRRIYPGSFTVGWRNEIEKDSSRKLHAIVKQDILEQVYASKGQHEKYRNAIVDGDVYENSGVPNYYLEIDASAIKSTNDIFNNIISISEAMKSHSPSASFLAQNYDPINDKQHGGTNRDLGVYVRWYAEGSMLHHEIVYDRPLEINSNDATNTLKEALSTLDVLTGDNFNIDRVARIISDKNIIRY